MSVNGINAISIVIFAVFILIGGIMGYVKAKSKPSLIAGTISAVVLFWCAWSTQRHPQTGMLRTLLVIAVLEGIFIVRLIKTRKFMPAGLMTILCVLEQAFLLWNSSRLSL